MHHHERAKPRILDRDRIPEIACAFDLLTDPKEEYPATALRNTWNAGPVMKIVADFEASLKKHPPIAPGTPDPYNPPKPKGK